MTPEERFRHLRDPNAWDLDAARTSVTAGTETDGAPAGRAWLVTAVVAVIVVGIAVLALSATAPGPREGLPAATPTGTTRTTQNATLLQHLPKQPYGRVVHTWTDADTTSTSGPFDVGGETVVIAAACDGGGEILITDAGGSPHLERCARLDIQQPFWKFDLGGDGQPTKEAHPVHVTVQVTAGHPDYLVRMWAVDPRILRGGWFIAATSPAVPRSLRTCAATDLAPVGTLDRFPHRQGGVVTVTNRSATDCAIRSWPTLQYLDTAGRRLGPLQGGDDGRSLDSTEGALNRFHEFPPARLVAGGHGYLIADLRTLVQLRKDDAEAAAAARQQPSPSLVPPPPLCHPEAVSALQLGIGGATIVVPVSSSPTAAACTDSSFAFGVNPVVAFRPKGE